MTEVPSQRPILDRNSLERDPLERDHPWTETSLDRTPTPGQRPPPLDRDPRTKNPLPDRDRTVKSGHSCTEILLEKPPEPDYFSIRDSFTEITFVEDCLNEYRILSLPVDQFSAAKL